MQAWLPTLLGLVAGCCSTAAFVPQVLKIWREGDTRAISLRMYVVLTAGFVLWLGYGLTLGSWPIIAFNAADPCLGAAMIELRFVSTPGCGRGNMPGSTALVRSRSRRTHERRRLVR